MKIWKVKHFACFQRSCRVSVFIDLVLFLVSDIFPVLMALNIMKSLNLNKWIICFTFSRERELPPATLHSCLLIFSDFPSSSFLLTSWHLQVSTRTMRSSRRRCWTKVWRRGGHSWWTRLITTPSQLSSRLCQKMRWALHLTLKKIKKKIS